MTQEVSDYIRTRNVEIVDAEGRTRIVLSGDFGGGDPMIAFVDDDSASIIELTLIGEASPAFTFFHKGNAVWAGGLSSEGDPYLEFPEADSSATAHYGREGQRMVGREPTEERLELLEHHVETIAVALGSLGPLVNPNWPYRRLEQENESLRRTLRGLAAAATAVEAVK